MGAGKIAHPFRIHPHHRQPRSGQRRDDCALQSSGGFQHDSLRAVGKQCFRQPGQRAGRSLTTELFDFVLFHQHDDVDPILGNVDSYPAVCVRIYLHGRDTHPCKCGLGSSPAHATVRARPEKAAQIQLTGGLNYRPRAGTILRNPQSPVSQRGSANSV